MRALRLGVHEPDEGPSGDPGAKPRKALVFFNAKTTFLTQTYIDIRLLT